MTKIELSKYGFDWGPAKITRACSDEQRGSIILLLETSKYQQGNALQIYVTKTGKISIHDSRGEWTAPKVTGKT